MTADMTALAIFELHRERLRAALARLVSAQDVDDLLHEGFLRFARNFERLGVIDDAFAYLHRIGQNVVAEGYRRRLPDSGAIEDAQPHHDHCASGALEWSAETARLRRAIDLLDPVDQALIILRHREGLPHKKIARQLQLSPNTVRIYLKRAEARLKVLMLGAHGRAIDRR